MSQETAPAADAGTVEPGLAASPQTTGESAPVVPESGQAQPPTSPAGTRTTHDGPDEPFFDPASLPPELEPAYKRLQGAFTRKMQELSKQRQEVAQKVQAYDAFSADPVGNLQKMAAQYGLKISRAEAAAQIANQQQQPQAQGSQGGEWQPQTWEEVEQRAAQRARSELMKELQPIIGNVQQMRAQTIERQLDDIDPEWRVHEDSMRGNLQKHPTLVDDPVMLYRLSIPADVQERRATQAAIARIEGKTRSGRVSGTTGSTVKSAEATKPAATFDEAVAQARRMLAEQGRR